MAYISAPNPKLPVTTTTAPTTAAACTCPACTGLKCLDRTRYFAGQLLTDGDLNHEQSYLLAKNRLHNRFLHGWGVVCGMQVVCSECDGWVTVKTGYAIDPCGNDIIVCQDYPFNVLKAIQACCKPAQTTSNCSPLRYTPPPPTCQDVSQTWCITIQYQEQQSRMVTPLQQTSSNGSCGTQGQTTMSGGTRASSSSSSSSSSTCGCSSSASQTSSTATTGACEPTRVIEGFQVGVVCEAPATSQTDGPQPGTLEYQICQCVDGLKTLYAQNPLPVGYSPTDQQAYQAVCNYLSTVQNALSDSFVTHCKLESKLADITVPTPPKDPQPDPDPAYIAKLQQVSAKIGETLIAAALDCFCTSLLPPCPPDPCDSRLILACVTVKNGKITNICHFGGGRRQVVTFPALFYWLSLSGLGPGLSDLCCGEEKMRERFLDTTYVYREAFTSTGFSNAAMMNHYVTSYVTQKIGAALTNAAVPTATTVDLRGLVGKNSADVSTALMSYQIATAPLQLKRDGDNNANSNIIVKDISADPAWTDSAVASSKQYAPAAFNITQPLTVYFKGDVAVGFDVTNPTDVLNNQVINLQRQVTALGSQLSQMQKQGAAAQPPGGAVPTTN
ncbi:MAG TPA: hypothetical protein VMR33_19450 [Candidatus Baltobacteraceae bacterium]|jgi:hypothetical protein|nr:hypothetical protein [Candidatus Baltobacteraceae bacterium]